MRIIASCDDGSKYDLKFAELMEKYKIPTVFYIPAEWHSYNLSEGREPLTYSDILWLSQTFEVGSHTITHPLLTRVDFDIAAYEISESQIMLEALLDKRVSKFAYPRGYANPEIKDVVAKHYEYGRNTLSGNLGLGSDEWTTPTVQISDSNTRQKNNWWNYALRMIDKSRALESDGFETIYHFWGHGWEIEKENSWNQLEELLKEFK